MTIEQARKVLEVLKNADYTEDPAIKEGLSIALRVLGRLNEGFIEKTIYEWNTGFMKLDYDEQKWLAQTILQVLIAEQK